MSDPRSIMDGPPRDSFEEELLEAARGDRMPESSRARVLVALGVGSTAGIASLAGLPESASAAQASTVPLAAGAGAWGKLLVGVGLVVLPAAAVGGWLTLARDAAPSAASVAPAAEASSAAAPGSAQARSVSIPTPAPAVSKPSAPVEVVTLEDLLAEPPPARRPEAAGAPAPSPGDARAVQQERPGSSLAEELSVVRKARSTLAAGSARAALEELDDYFARFPDARLRQEATVLRVEALLASGQREQAEALARPFLAENSAYASRLRQLLAK